MSDLRNLKVLAWFLQKFELNFDILSSLKELSKQIKGEFDFRWVKMCFHMCGWGPAIFHLLIGGLRQSVSSRLVSAPIPPTEHRPRVGF